MKKIIACSLRSMFFLFAEMGCKRLVLGKKLRHDFLLFFTLTSIDHTTLLCFYFKMLVFLSKFIWLSKLTKKVDQKYIGFFVLQELLPLPPMLFY